jgi:hypothetical protein
VAADFRNCGKMDYIVRQVSGGSVLLFENQMPTKHYLTVSLRGRQSNRQGIGARLVAKVNGQPVVRELYANNCFRGQAPPLVYFGLGKADRVEELSILWPSGRRQRLTNLKGDRHVLITEDQEGAAAVHEVVPGKIMPP